MATKNTKQEDSREAIEQFFAVTRTSLYRVYVSPPGNAMATKIALHGESKVPVGNSLLGGYMIAIGPCGLMKYTPEGHGMTSQLTSVERHIERVNTRWWGEGTSSIIALFLNQESAEACCTHADLQKHDSRWKDNTREVLDAIGEEHPNFYVCIPGNQILGSFL